MLDFASRVVKRYTLVALLTLTTLYILQLVMRTSDRHVPSTSRTKTPDIVDEAAQKLGALDINHVPRTGKKASNVKATKQVKKHYNKNKRIFRRAGEQDMKGFKATQTKVFEQRSFTNGTAKRMIFIGDIHGCSAEFAQLLEQVQYVAGEDQVVLVGDLVAKGPDSVGVVRKAREIGAWCVKGNHDDRVVRWREFLNGPAVGIAQSDLKSMESSDGLPYSDFEVGSKPHYDIARKLSPADYEFMAAFPAIIGLPDPFAEYVVAHGGIDPSKPILEQNPDDVMTMRNIGTNGPSSETEDGLGWFEVWAAKMKVLTLPSGGDFSAKGADYSVVRYNKVIYGHDAGRDLNIRDFTKGLDSRCVYGGKLTAFILPGEELVSVACKNYDGEESGTNDRRRRRRRHQHHYQENRNGNSAMRSEKPPHQRRLQERDSQATGRKVHPRKQQKSQSHTQGSSKDRRDQKKRQNHRQQRQEKPLPLAKY
ncbi:hypothetical protein FB639_000206 [Coemansia asiatica]|nr:hypothetical protein FB639_000206 [Coemansia asiatica]